MRDFLGAFVSVFLAIALCACSDSLAGDEAGDTSRSNILVDARDLQTYKTVEIGGRVWMAENLNYRVVWERDDFDSLIYDVGGFEHAADSLILRGFITDIQGGYYFMGYSSYFDEFAYFWTSDEIRVSNAYNVVFEKGRSSVSYDETYEKFALSVRCVKSR